jgi:hypothetical protein
MTIRAALVLVAACPALLTAQQRDGAGQKPLIGTAVISGVVRHRGQHCSVHAEWR